MNEVWVKTYVSDDYEVSSYGRVRNAHTLRLLHQHINREGGYFRVALHGRKYYVHRLVAFSFFESDSYRSDVNHIDGDRSHNAVSNLEIVSHQENIRHAWESGYPHSFATRVTKCRWCKHRGEYDICVGRNDDFYCAFGQN